MEVVQTGFQSGVQSGVPADASVAYAITFPIAYRAVPISVVVTPQGPTSPEFHLSAIVTNLTATGFSVTVSGGEVGSTVSVQWMAYGIPAFANYQGNFYGGTFQGGAASFTSLLVNNEVVTSSSFSADGTGLTPNTPTPGHVVLGGILNKEHGGTGTSSPSLIAGSNITITGSWPDQTISASGGGGGGSPGGNPGDVQFNNSGNFGGNDGFTWDNTNYVLTLDSGSSNTINPQVLITNSPSTNEDGTPRLYLYQQAPYGAKWGLDTYNAQLRLLFTPLGVSGTPVESEVLNGYFDISGAYHPNAGTDVGDFTSYGASCTVLGGIQSYNSITPGVSSTIGTATIWGGNGTPSFLAPAGSLYLSYDGTGGGTVYYNSSGAGTEGTSWSPIGGGGGGQEQYAIFTSSTTWTCPAGVTKVYALAVGGGGGGQNTPYGNTGGEGGAAYGYYTVIPGTSYTITVGTAGTGNLSGDGTSGNTSSFASFCSGTGGGGAIGSLPGTTGIGSGGNLRNSLSGGNSQLLNTFAEFNGSNVYGFALVPITTSPTVWSNGLYDNDGEDVLIAPGALGSDNGNGGVGGVVALWWIG